jgi:hypothetical protein
MAGIRHIPVTKRSRLQQYRDDAPDQPGLGGRPRRKLGHLWVLESLSKGGAQRSSMCDDAGLRLAGLVVRIDKR